MVEEGEGVPVERHLRPRVDLDVSGGAQGLFAAVAVGGGGPVVIVPGGGQAFVEAIGPRLGRGGRDRRPGDLIRRALPGHGANIAVPAAGRGQLEDRHHIGRAMREVGLDDAPHRRAVLDPERQRHADDGILHDEGAAQKRGGRLHPVAPGRQQPQGDREVAVGANGGDRGAQRGAHDAALLAAGDVIDLHPPGAHGLGIILIGTTRVAAEVALQHHRGEIGRRGRMDQVQHQAIWQGAEARRALAEDFRIARVVRAQAHGLLVLDAGQVGADGGAGIVAHRGDLLQHRAAGVIADAQGQAGVGRALGMGHPRRGQTRGRRPHPGGQPVLEAGQGGDGGIGQDRRRRIEQGHAGRLGVAGGDKAHLAVDRHQQPRLVAHGGLRVRAVQVALEQRAAERMERQGGGERGPVHRAAQGTVRDAGSAGRGRVEQALNASAVALAAVGNLDQGALHLARIGRLVGDDDHGRRRRPGVHRFDEHRRLGSFDLDDQGPHPARVEPVTVRQRQRQLQAGLGAGEIIIGQGQAAPRLQAPPVHEQRAPGVGAPGHQQVGRAGDGQAAGIHQHRRIAGQGPVAILQAHRDRFVEHGQPDVRAVLRGQAQAWRGKGKGLDRGGLIAAGVAHHHRQGVVVRRQAGQHDRVFHPVDAGLEIEAQADIVAQRPPGNAGAQHLRRGVGAIGDAEIDVADIRHRRAAQRGAALDEEAGRGRRAVDRHPVDHLRRRLIAEEIAGIHGDGVGAFRQARQRQARLPLVAAQGLQQAMFHGHRGPAAARRRLAPHPDHVDTAPPGPGQVLAEADVEFAVLRHRRHRGDDRRPGVMAVGVPGDGAAQGLRRIGDARLVTQRLHAVGRVAEYAVGGEAAAGGAGGDVAAAIVEIPGNLVIGARRRGQGHPGQGIDLGAQIGITVEIKGHRAGVGVLDGHPAQRRRGGHAGRQHDIGAHGDGVVRRPGHRRRDAEVGAEPIGRIDLADGPVAEIVGLVGIVRVDVVGGGRPGIQALGVEHDAGGVVLPPGGFGQAHQQLHRVGVDGHARGIGVIPDVGTAGHGVVAARRVVDGEELHPRAGELAIVEHRHVEGGGIAGAIKGDEAQQQVAVPDGQMHPARDAVLVAVAHRQVGTGEHRGGLVGDLTAVRPGQIDALEARVVGGEAGMGIGDAAGDDPRHAITRHQRLGGEGVVVVGPAAKQGEAAAHDRWLAIDDHRVVLAGDQGALVAEDLGAQGVAAIERRGRQFQGGAVIGDAPHGDAIVAGQRRRLGGRQLGAAAIQGDSQPPVDARGENEGHVPGGVDRRRLGLRGLRLAVGIGVAVLHQHPGVQPAADAQGDTGHHRAQEFQHRHHLGLRGGTANPNLGGDVAPPLPYPAPGLPAAPQGVQRAVLLAWPLSLTAVTDTLTRPRANSSAVKRTVCADFCPRSLGLAGASA